MLKVYSQSMGLLGVLDSAEGIGYELKHNDLWTGSFQLPSSDPKNEQCAAHNYVRIDDGDRDVGLYRIVGMPQSRMDDWTEYDLEHVMATLVDDVLFGAHEIGGAGVYTDDVIRYVLARQTVTRWQLGTCDFRYQFAYHLENCTLLAALMSISAVLVDAYTWEWDTSTTPWTVNLRAADATPGCGIHYMRNLKQIEKTMDATTLVTRMYCLGYGEGVNQLTIGKVNGGKNYIDADTVGTWGVKCSVFADTTIQDAETLKQRGLAVLDGYKNPYITYTASAVDLYALTGQSWDNHMPGKLVQVMDGEHGISFQARIVSMSKGNVRGEPQDIEITIANAPKDAADSINTLADRVGIHELNSQGATSLYVFQFAENCDASHPATFNVPIPESAYRINTVKFLLKREAYRAYEQGAESGGGTETTSSANGGGTRTSSAGGSTQVTEDQRIVSTTAVTGGTISGRTGDTSGNTGGALDYSGNNISSTGSTTPGRGGGPVDSIGSSATLTATNSSYNTGSGGNVSTTSAGGGSTDTSDNTSHSHGCGDAGSHFHTVTNHRHKLDTYYTEYTQPGCTSAGTHDHSINSATCSHKHYVYPHSHTGGSHTHTIGGHSHSFAHYHAGAAHTHSMTHMHNFSHSHNVVVAITVPGITISIPAHTHTVTTNDHTHTVTLGTHTHALIYGIFEGTTASSFTLSVDGTAYAEPLTSAKVEMDITALLEKDANGKIKRGDWHEVKLTPDRATRAVVSVYVQCFVQSKGGGDF